MLVSAAVLAMPVRRMRRAMPLEKQQITRVLRARKSAWTGQRGRLTGSS
jgi:hypothetical protein